MTPILLTQAIVLFQDTPLVYDVGLHDFLFNAEIVSKCDNRLIEMENVSKWYGDLRVLKDCSTRVEKGDVVVVCGPSGSGKRRAH